ncbi:cytochrome c biogenesis protein CcdA [Psychrobacter sp. DM4]|uniref:cytochrome c biogenesis protein CcdA n=1 Tax=Psychrobacter sp. DM4 TaxID=3440637 RepID=UPI003F4FBA33
MSVEIKMLKKISAKKSYAFAIVLASSSIMGGIAVTSVPTQAASLGDLFGNKSAAQSKFLPVNEAFEVTSSSKPIDSKATGTGTRLAINFDITPEHYVYKDQIKLTLPTGVKAAPFTYSQASKSIDDPTFGQVPIFDQSNMVATTTLTNTTGNSIDEAKIVIGWQGCAKAGLCYPPEKINTTVSIAATPQNSTPKPAASADTKATTDKEVATNTDTNAAATPAVKNTQAKTVAALTNNIQQSNTSTNAAIDRTTAETGETANDETVFADGQVITDENELSDSTAEPINPNAMSTTLVSDSSTIGASSESINNAATDNLVDSDPFGLATHPWLALLLLFLAGLGLALTPCVLPMLPIVANIVGRQENPTVKKGVVLTTSYAIGVATAYGILGAVIAIFGESLGIIGWLQNPIILIGFAIVFILLALYMLGVFTTRLPQVISSKMQGLSQAGDSKLGSTGGSLVAGFLSALVVSPCVSAPLFGALLAVSTIGSPWLGFAALFMLGFGLSAPLILIGATQGKIMPKAGVWMDWIKQGFALLLFAVALLLIERVFVSSVMLLVWALWFMVVAMWAWRWIGRGRMLTQALALIAGIWAACLIIGAALGNDDSLYPLASLSATSTVNTNISNSSTNDRTITTLAQLEAITADSPKVIVDVTADWCIECRIMDKNLFQNRPAQMQEWQLVRLDITDTTEDSKAILARFQLFGPPALLYYQDGQLITQQVGEIGRQEFEKTLTALNQ